MTRTWTKDNNGLFDYESVSLKRQQMMIEL
jgi:hypothetical protein